jgi:hypothetical protein
MKKLNLKMKELGLDGPEMNMLKRRKAGKKVCRLHVQGKAC